MEQISFYLKKYGNLGLREKNVKKVVLEAILKVSGVTVTEDEVEINRDQIRIKKSGVEKSEIFINHKSIEREIDEMLGGGEKRVL